jgi:hypothetical protein
MNLPLTPTPYSPQMATPRPFVRFEVRAQEHRGKSLEAGAPVFEDVCWALVTAPGSRDSLEIIATDWITRLRQHAREGRVPQDWPAQYDNALAEFLKNQEQPAVGSPLKLWPAISPAQLQNALRANITTIEALAEANEESLQRLGMGGMALRESARSWLKESKSAGTLARAVEDLTLQVETLKRELADARSAAPKVK